MGAGVWGFRVVGVGFARCWRVIGGWLVPGRGVGAGCLAVSGWGLPWLRSCICGGACVAGLALGNIYMFPYRTTIKVSNSNYMLNSGRKILVVVTLQ